MRNAKTNKSRSTNLFCHCDDQGFKLLDSLEELLARMVPSPGSRFLRERLHRASARLAQIVITFSDEDAPDKLRARYKPALVLSRVIDGLLRLLRRYAVLTASEQDEALNIAKRLIRAIAGRYYGSDLVDSEDDSSSGSAPPDAAPLLIIESEGSGIAANGARKSVPEA